MVDDRRRLNCRDFLVQVISLASAGKAVLKACAQNVLDLKKLLAQRSSLALAHIVKRNLMLEDTVSLRDCPTPD